jgi:(heptosyl)LPS beta-1,4-glucosyltransferase
MAISVVINTWNEERNLPRAIKSVKGWADEIIVVDMESADETVTVANKLGARVYKHKWMGYVEPARNFAIGKAKGEWVLVLDADEEVGEKLKENIKYQISNIKQNSKFRNITYIRIPRKNIVFGKWLQYSRWWPDYNIRFFKKGFVDWSENIHGVPETRGEGMDLPAQEELALTHYHYNSVSQFVRRMDRYSAQQLKVLQNRSYIFRWQDLISKPVDEFLSRYFAGEGYRDGLHGLALALLQGFSELVLYLKAWEDEGFREQRVDLEDFDGVIRKSAKDFAWWMGNYYEKSKKLVLSLVWKVQRKLL